jgi:hypothetical protein
MVESIPPYFKGAYMLGRTRQVFISAIPIDQKPWANTVRNVSFAEITWLSFILEKTAFANNHFLQGPEHSSS